jgi:PPOX class probable F420-dependent enzyme
VRQLDPTEIQAFLREGARTAKVAVVWRDGSPLVTPVWFLCDDEGLVLFETEAESVKGRALRRDPRISVCVEDDRPPFAFVRIDGTAELDDDLEGLVGWTTRIAGRYMGAENADEYGRRNAGPGHLLVRVRPTTVVALAELAV